MYQIGPRETRVLVDIPGKLPSNSSGELKSYMETVVAPELPESIRVSWRNMECVGERCTD